MGFGIGAEQLRVQLREDIANAIRFVRELHAEEGLKKVEQRRCNFGLEGRHIGKGQKEPD